MGLFDFFKKKPSENKQADRQQSEPRCRRFIICDFIYTKQIKHGLQIRAIKINNFCFANKDVSRDCKQKRHIMRLILTIFTLIPSYASLLTFL